MSVLVTIKINWRFKSLNVLIFFPLRLWSCSAFSTNKIELTLGTRSWVRLVKWQLAAEITSFFNVESELRNERIYELAFTKKCKFLMFGLCSGIPPLWCHINIFAQTPETCKLSCIKQSVLKLVPIYWVFKFSNSLDGKLVTFMSR